MRERVQLSYPFTGRWLVQNSPAVRVPSHGTTRFGSSYAIDFVPVTASGRTAPVTLATLLRPEPPHRFPGYGRTVLAPVDGVVVAAVDRYPDHSAYRGLPSISYALTQGRRVAAGWGALAGNLVLIETGGVFVALCHLQHGSVQVRVGHDVRRATPLGRCGNSGNSTQPHVHVQASTSADFDRADAVPIAFDGVLPSDGDIVDVP